MLWQGKLIHFFPQCREALEDEVVRRGSVVLKSDRETLPFFNTG